MVAHISEINAGKIPSTTAYPVYLPVYMEFGGKEKIIKNNELLLDQLGEQIGICQKDDRIVVSDAYSDGIPLYKHPDKLDKFKGDIHVGVFTILNNNQNQLLFIKKKCGHFWSLPGGLIEKCQDKSLWKTAKRKLQEQTGVVIDIQEKKPICAYESFIPLNGSSRHNIMVFFSAQYSMSERLNVDNQNIEKYAWISPALFLSTYQKDEKFSCPMILTTLNEFRKVAMNQVLNNEFDRFWYQYGKKKIISSDKELLFDLCFIEVCKNGKQGRHMDTLLELTLNLVKADHVYTEDVSPNQSDSKLNQ